MAKFIQDFKYATTTYSGDFKKGDEAPAAYPEIIAAAVKAGALKGGANADIDTQSSTVDLKG